MAKKKHTLLKTVGAITVGAATSLAVANQILVKKEKKYIYNYGNKVETVYGNMNVSISGEGEETIVLLSGYGTSAPILDFKPLEKALSSFARVISIEYFGYGDSDDTERERTVENICEEVHLCLEQLKVKKYWLMPHSISGVYALAYTNYYPEEVAGVLAIDTSVPKQVDKANPKLETVLSKFMHYTGVGRVLMHVKPSMFIGGEDVYAEEVLKQIRLRQLQKASMAIEKEGQLLAVNMNKCRDMSWPEKMPFLLFICKSTIEKTKGWWLDIHEEQMQDLETCMLVPLEGTHYLHWDNAEQMAEEAAKFMAFNKEAMMFE